MDAALHHYVDGRLDGSTADRVGAHLEGCASCRERLAAIRELEARLADLPRGIAPRRDLRKGIRRRLREGGSSAPADRGAGADRRGPGWLRAAAVVLAVAGGGTALWLGIHGGTAAPGAPDTVIASYASASADLARTVEDRKSGLGPAGARALDRSLASLDVAIGELERARRRDGADPELLRQLEARHRARLELLRGAVTLLEES